MSSLILTRPARSNGPSTTVNYTVVNPTEFQYSGVNNSNVSIYNNETGALVAVLSPSNQTFITSLPGVYRLETNSVCCSDIAVWAGDIVIGGGGSGSVTLNSGSVATLPDICGQVDGGDAEILTPVALFDENNVYTGTRYMNRAGVDVGSIANVSISDDCDCECSECSQEPVLRNCFYMRAFDSFPDEYLEEEETANFRMIVDGVLQFSIDTNYIANSDEEHKSSWYAELVSAVNNVPGFTMSVAGDVSTRSYGKKVTWMFEYLSVNNADVTVEFIYNNNDHYIITLHGDGTFTGSTFDDGVGAEFGSSPHILACGSPILRNCILLNCWDGMSNEYIEPGETQNFKFFINGAFSGEIDVDYTSTSDGSGKMSWYTDVVNFINNNVQGVDFIPFNDVPEDSNGEKPTYMINYSATSNSDVTFEMWKNNTDRYIIEFMADGSTNGTTLDTIIGAEFATDPYMECEE